MASSYETNYSYVIPQLKEEHKRNLCELIHSNDNRLLNYLDRLYLNYTYETIEKTYWLTEIECRIIYYICQECATDLDIIHELDLTFDSLEFYKSSICAKMRKANVLEVDLELINITINVINEISSYLDSLYH